MLIDKVNQILINQIKLFDILQEHLDKQKNCIKDNKLFELDNVGVKINDICKRIAEVEINLRNLIGEQTLKNFIMDNKQNKELYGSYIFLISQIERLSLVKNDNQFLIKKSLNFINKMLSSISNSTTKSNVYVRKNIY